MKKLKWAAVAVTATAAVAAIVLTLMSAVTGDMQFAGVAMAFGPVLILSVPTIVFAALMEVR